MEKYINIANNEKFPYTVFRFLENERGLNRSYEGSIQPGRKAGKTADIICLSDGKFRQMIRAGSVL